MNKKELIQKYTKEAGNLNHNIILELQKGHDTPNWNGQCDFKMVEYMKGQLSIIREVVHLLRDDFKYPSEITEKFDIDYFLGEPI